MNVSVKGRKKNWQHSERLQVFEFQTATRTDPFVAVFHSPLTAHYLRQPICGGVVFFVGLPLWCGRLLNRKHTKKRERKPLNFCGLCALCGKLRSNLTNHALFWHQYKDLGFTGQPAQPARQIMHTVPQPCPR